MQEDEQDDDSDECYELFKNIPMEMVTMQQGTKEWHLRRSFSLTLSTMLELTSVLNWRKVNWPDCKAVQAFYSKQEYNKKMTHQGIQPVQDPLSPPLDRVNVDTSSPIIPRQLLSAT